MSENRVGNQHMTQSTEITQGAEPDDYDPYEYEECGQCDGSGFVFDCWDGFCQDAEIGCDLCTQRCDFCNPAKPSKDTEKLRQILGEALETTHPQGDRTPHSKGE